MISYVECLWSGFSFSSFSFQNSFSLLWFFSLKPVFQGERDRWHLRVSLVLFISKNYLRRITRRRAWNEELRFRTLACFLDLPSMILFYIFRRFPERSTLFWAPTIRDALLPVNFLKSEACDLGSSFFSGCQSSHRIPMGRAGEASFWHLGWSWCTG